MSDQSGGPVFNIGSQHAGAIYQSAGDQIVHHGGGTLSAGVLSAVSEVRSALTASAPTLSEVDRAHAEDALGAVEDELREPEPDRARVAGRLAQVASALNRAGTLAASADALYELAGWLGPAGQAVLGALV